MDKIKELLEDENNKIIAIAICIVVVLAAVLLIAFMVKGKSNNSDVSVADNGMPPGMPGMPGMGPDGSGMPGMMPDGSGMPGMPGSGMPGVGPEGSSMQGMGSDTGMPESGGEGDVTVAKATGPIEVGRIDPFAPIGVAKASKTKTFGDAIKASMFSKGVDFRIPGLLEAISFTDYTASTKIGYQKSDAELKKEADKKIADKKAKEKEFIDRYKKVIYSKPVNIRLSSIMEGKNTLATFEVVLGGRNDFESLKVGESLTYGYNYEGKPLKAKVKSIGKNSAVLEALDVDDVEWKYNVSDGTVNYMNNGMGGMPGMAGMPGGMGGMSGMDNGFGSMPGGMPGMDNGFGGMPGGMPGMDNGFGGMPGMGNMPGMNRPGMGGLNGAFNDMNNAYGAMNNMF